MHIAFFSTLPFEQFWFEQYQGHHQLTYIPDRLSDQTVHLAEGHQAVCAFVNDDLSRSVLQQLQKMGVRVVGMRCAGIDNVDQLTLDGLGMTLLRVPGYSPYAVAEQAVALLLGLVRHIPEANRRVLAGNFTIDGLVGSTLHGKKVGVVGTGHIGKAFARIMQGFGCSILAHDIRPDRSLLESGVVYLPLRELLSEADIISLHCPLSPLTDRLIQEKSLTLLKPTAFLINTGRGRLVDTRAVLNALDHGQLAGYAADVYEGEKLYFHTDFSTQPIADALLNRLRYHPKVLLTAHQGFLTDETLQQITRGLLNQFSFYENQQSAQSAKASIC